MLIPMYFIIGIWGGDRRLYASIKFVIYTMVGSLLMLVAILYLYAQFHAVTGTYSFDYAQLSHLTLPAGPQMLCFAAFALAFAIKVPIFPLHTWLPDAHVEAPTGGSVILAGVLLKFGAYGFLRYALPLFPLAAAQAAPVLAVLAVIGIVYGALMAYVQDDAKKLVAYSSVSHLGFVVLGIFSMNTIALQGAIYQMVAHGITTGGLFFGVGWLYDRRHTRKLADFGGLWAKTPVFAALFLAIVLGSVGLPGLCGFVGEFLVLIGTFTAHKSWVATGLVGYFPAPKLMGAIAATAVILAAMYLLTMYQKLMFGPLDNPKNKTVRDVARARDHRAGDRRAGRAGHGARAAADPEPHREDRRRVRHRLPRSVAGRAPPAGCAGPPFPGAGGCRGALLRPGGTSLELRRLAARRLSAHADPDRHGLPHPARRDVHSRDVADRAGLDRGRVVRRLAGGHRRRVAGRGYSRRRTSTAC